MDALRIPLRIVFYRDDDGDWIARCLEFDLCGDGSTKEAAAAMLTKAIDIQVEQSTADRNLANLLTPAESEYFRMFAAGHDVAVAELHLSPRSPSPILIESMEAREYDSSAADAGRFTTSYELPV
ncbi:MAG: hypothetical protein SGJ19_03590 [Planctomycetia bacterium]|nr:hypothetical protein [Planctomycetia bacterium]